MILLILESEGEYDSYTEFVTHVCQINTEKNGDILNNEYREYQHNIVISHPDYKAKGKRDNYLGIHRKIKFMEFYEWLKLNYKVKEKPFNQILP